MYLYILSQLIWIERIHLNDHKNVMSWWKFIICSGLYDGPFEIVQAQFSLDWKKWHWINLH